jgi:hypothetical protein
VPLFVVVNGSQRNYQQLEVILHVDGDADEYDGAPVLLDDLLPRAPRLWGPSSMLDGPMLYSGIGPSVTPGPSTHIQRGGSFTLTFAPVNLRPGGSAILDDTCTVLIPATRAEPVIARWTATCLNVDATATGAVPIHFEGPDIDPIDALAQE